MSEYLLDKKALPLAKRKVIDDLHFRLMERFNELCIMKKITDENETAHDRDRVEYDRLLWGKRAYVVQYSMDISLPYEAWCDRAFDYKDISVPVEKFVEVLEDYVLYLQEKLDCIQKQVRRIKKTDNEDTIDFIQSRRRLCKKYAIQSSVIKELTKLVKEHLDIKGM